MFAATKFLMKSSGAKVPSALLSSITINSSALKSIALTPDNLKALIANGSPSWESLYSVNLATSAVTAINLSRTTRRARILPNGTKAYIVSPDANTTSVLDLSNNSVVKTISMGSGSSPHDVAISPSGNNVFVLKRSTSEIAVINSSTDSVTNTFATGYSYPEAITLLPNGSTIYTCYTYNGSNSVRVHNASTYAYVTSISVGSGPAGMAASPDGTKLYVANQYGNSVSVIATASNTVTDTISVGPSPRSIAVSPDSSKAYVTNADNGTISVINTATKTVTKTIATGSGVIPLDIAVTSDGSTALVVNEGGTIAVIG